MGTCFSFGRAGHRDASPEASDPPPERKRNRTVHLWWPLVVRDKARDRRSEYSSLPKECNHRKHIHRRCRSSIFVPDDYATLAEDTKTSDLSIDLSNYFS